MRCKQRGLRAISRVGVIDVNVNHSMNIGRVLQGGLFTSDFLIDAVQEMDEWQRWDEGAVLETELQNVFNAFECETYGGPSIASNIVESTQKRVDTTGCIGIYFFVQDNT